MTKVFGLLVSLLLTAPAALAQFKCVSPGGSVSFQQTPCATNAKSERLQLRQGSAPERDASGSTGGEPARQQARTGLSADERSLRNLERDRQIRDLTRQIEDAERQAASRPAQMTAELDAIKAKKSLARNNLAGATWEQSLSTEMNAVTAKYQNIASMEAEQLRALRSELQRVKSTAP